MRLVERLVEERDAHIGHALYYWTQVSMCFNSNHMEGSTLTAAQTAQIFETGAFQAGAGESIRVDDAIETTNHFQAFDHILDHVDDPVDKDFVCTLHRILKSGTRQARITLSNVGGYKVADNEIVQMLGVTSTRTAPAAAVPRLMERVFAAYTALDDDPVRIAACHWAFEKVHPFADGNGRVGRLVMFKECLRLDTVPPIVNDSHHAAYVNALGRFPGQPGWLVDLLLSERDAYLDHYVRRLAPKVEFGYNDSWDARAHAADLARAASFAAAVEERG